MDLQQHRPTFQYTHSHTLNMNYIIIINNMWVKRLCAASRHHIVVRYISNVTMRKAATMSSSIIIIIERDRSAESGEEDERNKNVFESRTRLHYTFIVM